MFALGLSAARLEIPGLEQSWATSGLPCNKLWFLLLALQVYENVHVLLGVVDLLARHCYQDVGKYPGLPIAM